MAKKELPQIEHTVTQVQTAFAIYTITESRNGHLLISLHGPGSITLALTGDRQSVEVIAPSNRIQKHKTRKDLIDERHEEWVMKLEKESKNNG